MCVCMLYVLPSLGLKFYHHAYFELFGVLGLWGGGEFGVLQRGSEIVGIRAMLKGFAEHDCL